MMDDDPRLALLFALADDELILGHRHSEWTGWAPHIEEDLAFSSIAQDEMAHARQRFADGLSRALSDAVALFEPLPGEDQLVKDGVLSESNEDLLGRWLERLGAALEDVSLDYVFEHHGPLGGEMVPTSSGEIEA